MDTTVLASLVLAGSLLLLLAGGVWVGLIVAKRGKRPAPATDDTDQEW